MAMVALRRKTNLYQVNVEIYIIATNDIVNFDESNTAAKVMNIGGATVCFTVTYDN